MKNKELNDAYDKAAKLDEAFEALKEEAMGITRAAFWTGVVVGAIFGAVLVTLVILLALS